MQGKPRKLISIVTACRLLGLLVTERGRLNFEHARKDAPVAGDAGSAVLPLKLKAAA